MRALSVILGLLLAVCGWVAAGDVCAVVSDIKPAYGTVSVNLQPVKKGSAIRLGQKVSTSPGTVAQIQLMDTTFLVLGPGTDLYLQQAQTGEGLSTTVKLDQGKLRFVTSSAASKAGFTVVTKTMRTKALGSEGGNEVINNITGQTLALCLGGRLSCAGVADGSKAPAILTAGLHITSTAQGNLRPGGATSATAAQIDEFKRALQYFFDGGYQLSAPANTERVKPPVDLRVVGAPPSAPPAAPTAAPKAAAPSFSAPPPPIVSR